MHGNQVDFFLRCTKIKSDFVKELRKPNQFLCWLQNPS